MAGLKSKIRRQGLCRCNQNLGLFRRAHSTILHIIAFLYMNQTNLAVVTGKCAEFGRREGREDSVSDQEISSSSEVNVSWLLGKAYTFGNKIF
jgi:hypothetical protein